MLAAATRLPYRGEPLRPAWAALSDGALARFPVIDGVERLIVLADNDINGAGQAAADDCKQRWLEAGRRVRPAHARSPRHRFQRHRSRKPGARIMSTGLPQKSSSPMRSRTPPPTAPATPRRRSTAAMAATPRAETTPATPRRAIPVTRRPVATRAVPATHAGRCSAPPPITVSPARS